MRIEIEKKIDYEDHKREQMHLKGGVRWICEALKGETIRRGRGHAGGVDTEVPSRAGRARGGAKRSVMHPRSSVLRFVGRRACRGEPVGTGCFWQRGTIKWFQQKDHGLEGLEWHAQYCMFTLPCWLLWGMTWSGDAQRIWDIISVIKERWESLWLSWKQE